MEKIKSFSLIIGEYCVESETKAKSIYLNFQYNSVFNIIMFEIVTNQTHM